MYRYISSQYYIIKFHNLDNLQKEYNPLRLPRFHNFDKKNQKNLLTDHFITEFSEFWYRFFPMRMQCGAGEEVRKRRASLLNKCNSTLRINFKISFIYIDFIWVVFLQQKWIICYKTNNMLKNNFIIRKISKLNKLSILA